MYPKFKTIALVKKFSPFLIAKLGMKKFKIELHVYHSQSKFLKSRGFKAHGMRGCSMTSAKCADVVIFYDQCLDRNDAISTLVHELLHVRIRELTDLVTFNLDKAVSSDERIVAALEKFIMETLDFEKLLA